MMGGTKLQNPFFFFFFLTLVLWIKRLWDLRSFFQGLIICLMLALWDFLFIPCPFTELYSLYLWGFSGLYVLYSQKLIPSSLILCFCENLEDNTNHLFILGHSIWEMWPQIKNNPSPQINPKTKKRERGKKIWTTIGFLYFL